jgi:hypothetical protein
MTNIKAFIKRHPVLTYYALTFAISWGGMLLVIGGPGGIPGTPEQIERLMLLVVLALMAGPSVAGLLLTGLVDGQAGLRELLSRLRRWRVGARWYAIALLALPLLATATLFALSLTSPVFLPGIVTTDDKASLLLSGIAVGLMGASWRSSAGRGSPCRSCGGVTVSLPPGSSWASCGERGTS